MATQVMARRYFSGFVGRGKIHGVRPFVIIADIRVIESIKRGGAGSFGCFHTDHSPEIFPRG